MNLTNTQRVKRVVGNLIANPDLIFPYFETSIFNKKLPIDLEMPWWSFRAIERADGLMAGKHVFEYGTGGSTLRFAKMAKRIVSVEDHPDWAEIVRKRLALEAISNVEIRLHPFDFKSPIRFEDSNYIAAVDSEPWDIVIIDGQDWTFRERIACFRRVEPKMKPDSVIIVDDFWRYEELLGSNRASRVEVHESVGPARLGVTSTAFFFYSASPT
jgi:hypothetical protein